MFCIMISNDFLRVKRIYKEARRFDQASYVLVASNEALCTGLA